MTALEGFLRRQGYLSGHEVMDGENVVFYRLGSPDRRIVLNGEQAPWTLTSEQQDQDGQWVALAPAKPVRDYVIDVQSAANDVDADAEPVWPVLGATLNDVLRQSHGWIAEMDESSNDNNRQTILFGTSGRGVERRLILWLAGPQRGEAMLEMLSHGEPSEWLPLDHSRLPSLLRSKNAATAVAEFLRLA